MKMDKNMKNRLPTFAGYSSEKDEVLIMSKGLEMRLPFKEFLWAYETVVAVRGGTGERKTNP